jgi:hypothetical protein
MNPAKRLKVDSTFGGGERLHGEQEVELELEQVADFLKVSRPLNGSVGDPNPQDSHVCGPPGSGSICQRSGSGSFPLFSLMC